MSIRNLLIGLGAALFAAGGVVAVFVIASAFPATHMAQRVAVVIDAGHGGEDPGGVVEGIQEADVNLEIAKKVVKLLAFNPDLHVIMTRQIDMFSSHEQRIAVAEDSNAALYVSIQANTCGSPDVTGIETWVDDAQQPGTESWVLAELIQDALISGTKSRDRGVRSMGLYLGRIPCPAVLVETGFLTSREEREKLLSVAYQQIVAQCIVDGILAFIEG